MVFNSPMLDEKPVLYLLSQRPWPGTKDGREVQLLPQNKVDGPITVSQS